MDIIGDILLVFQTHQTKDNEEEEERKSMMCLETDTRIVNIIQ